MIQKGRLVSEIPKKEKELVCNQMESQLCLWWLAPGQCGRLDPCSSQPPAKW